MNVNTKDSSRIPSRVKGRIAKKVRRVGTIGSMQEVVNTFVGFGVGIFCVGHMELNFNCGQWYIYCFSA